MSVKTHKNKSGIDCRWAIALLFNEGIRYVTKLDNASKTFYYENGTEAMFFNSKQNADDLILGMLVNGYPAVVMEVADGLILKNPEKRECENKRVVEHES